MSIGNVPLLSVLQLGQAEKTLETLQNNAQNQHAMLQDQATTELKKQQQQIEKTQSPEKKRRRAVDEKEERQGAQYHSQKRNKQEPENQDPETAPTPQTPWVGIMVNRKI